MLGKKMFREIRGNLGQFLSLFILAFLAISLFACMKASNISARRKLSDLQEDGIRSLRDTKLKQLHIAL